MRDVTMIFPGRVSATILGLLLFLTLCLSACGADVDQTITLYDDATWKAEGTITIAQQTLLLAGGAVEVERALDEQMNELTGNGIRASWSATQEGELVHYNVTASGQDHATFAHYLDGAQLEASREAGRDLIYFSLNTSNGLFSGGNTTITLIADEVVESNGTEFEPGKVRWVNPAGKIEALVVGKPHTNIGLIVGVILGAALLGSAIIAVMARRARPGTSHAKPSTLTGRHCGFCGQKLPSGTNFCPACGQPTFPDK